MSVGIPDEILQMNLIQSQHLNVTGLLGALLEAKNKGLISRVKGLGDVAHFPQGGLTLIAHQVKHND